MSELKPVLIVSYFFPPIGMAGSARAYGLFRYLPEYGYRPFVVTVKDIVYPAYDTTLLSRNDERYIIRTESLDPSRALWCLGRRKVSPSNHTTHLSKWITPDYKRLWVSFAIRSARRLIARESIGLVVTTSPTPSAHIVGQDLRQSCDVRWIADYRDMWVTRPIAEAYAREAQRTTCHKLLHMFREKADCVTAVNDSIAKYTGADRVIPNGVDPLTCALWDSAPMSDSVFRIGYLGTTDSAETINTFVSALSATLVALKLNSASVRVCFVGAVDDVMLRECFAEGGLSQALECHGYLPRKVAIETLADVDALLVTIPEELSFVTPSKMFDCLVSGKPLIVLAPHNSELATLARGAGERVFAKDKQSALQHYIAELIEAKRMTGVASNSLERLSVIQSRREEYSWRTMARRFASIFDELSLKSVSDKNS